MAMALPRSSQCQRGGLPCRQPIFFSLEFGGRSYRHRKIRQRVTGAGKPIASEPIITKVKRFFGFLKDFCGRLVTNFYDFSVASRKERGDFGLFSDKLPYFE
jgi:hypothetical protein